MILAITGKSGTGKHTAAQFFGQRGWKILDADKLAHQLYRPYQRSWKAIVERFGQDILTKDDQIDRQKLKKIVFGNTQEADQALRDLNQIIHPELQRHLKDEVYYSKKKNENAVLVGALWKELGFAEICDQLVLIKADPAIAFERVKKRDGVDRNTFDASIRNQTEPEKPAITVENSGSFQDFYKKLNSILTPL